MMQSWQNEELKETVETLVNLDEPEALLTTLSRTVQRRRGPRWQALALVLGEAETKLDQLLNAQPAGPDFRPPVDDEFTDRAKEFVNRGRAAQAAVNELGAGKPEATAAEPESESAPQ